MIITPFIGATDFGVYFLLVHFRLPYSVAKGISYIIANGAGYVFNKYWIFKCKKPSYPEAGRYLIVDLALFVCNIIINQAVLHMWPKAILPAVAIASVSTAVLSFICKKFWIFKVSPALNRTSAGPRGK